MLDCLPFARPLYTRRRWTLMAVTAFVICIPGAAVAQIKTDSSLGHRQETLPLPLPTGTGLPHHAEFGPALRQQSVPQL